MALKFVFYLSFIKNAMSFFAKKGS